jgi:hypothetical protein
VVDAWGEEHAERSSARPEATRCGECYGRGEKRTPYMDYAMAYQALERLVKEELATRRPKLDEWGEPTQGVVYMPAEQPDPDDPLERLYALPPAECAGGHEAKSAADVRTRYGNDRGGGPP